MQIVGFGGNVEKVSDIRMRHGSLRMIGITQGHRECLPLLSDDLRTHIRGHPQCGGTLQDIPSQYRDASGRRKDTRMGIRILRRLMDGVYGSLFLSWMSAY